MKTSLVLLILAAVLGTELIASNAADKRELGGPKGGRLLEKAQPRAEFYLENDHTVTIAFYDVAMKPMAVAGQSVSVIAETKHGKITVEFEKKGDVLVSKTKLPEGDGYTVVVRFQQTANARPQNIRFKLDTHRCGTCQRAEYACICDE